MPAPTLVVLAGPNGAGKSTFFELFLRSTGIRFVNADVIARAIRPDDPMAVSLQAAEAADVVRHSLVELGESFCMETVFSDPVGAKLGFIQHAKSRGYRVVLVFVGLASAELSQARVIQRVAEGGHDVPDEKIFARYPRSLRNLERALGLADEARIFDNSDAQAPYRLVARLENGAVVERPARVPAWCAEILGG